MPKYSAKYLQKKLASSTDEKLSALAELLEALPHGRKKFKYGAHFSVALKLFESLANDEDALDTTLKYLEREHLLDTFRKGCIRAFDHVATEFTQYTAPLKDLKEGDDLDAHRENNKESRHSLNKLERLTVAANFVHVDSHHLSRFIHALREFRNARRNLNILFKRDDRLVRKGKRPTQFQLSQLQARNNQRRTRLQRS